MLEISGVTWAVTIALIVGLLALDLVLASVRPHRVGFREATAWSVFYIAVAIAFGVWFAWAYGGDSGTQYFAGYIVEKSLSVDNLFVFVIIMTTFAVPEEHQHKVLTFGIVLALIMRAIFIALGATLLSLFSFMFLMFGLLLVYTAVQLFRHRDEDPDVEDNVVVKTARRVLPVTEEYDGGKIFTRVDGRRMVTPLLMVLVAIGGIDLLFALDSIPAVFGVTEEPYIVFTANAFALLGLRALFFLVKGLLDRLVYLSTGLSVILAFIGVKLILHWGHVDISASVPEISTPVSLAVIIVVLVVVTVASLIKTRRDPTAKAHAGSLRATAASPLRARRAEAGAQPLRRPAPPSGVRSTSSGGPASSSRTSPMPTSPRSGDSARSEASARPHLGDPDRVGLVGRGVDHVELAAGRVAQAVRDPEQLVGQLRPAVRVGHHADVAADAPATSWPSTSSPAVTCVTVAGCRATSQAPRCSRTPPARCEGPRRAAASIVRPVSEGRRSGRRRPDSRSSVRRPMPEGASRPQRGRRTEPMSNTSDQGTRPPRSGWPQRWDRLQASAGARPSSVWSGCSSSWSSVSSS